VKTALAVLFVTACVALRADELHHHSDPAQKVGKVSFTVSCSLSAQNKIEHGLALMHSFLFEDAEDQFRIAATEDSTCAMAYWAEAIGVYRPLAYLPTDADMKRGWERIERAIELDAKTPRERAYIEAARALYQPDERTYDTRNHDYSAAMERLYQDYPNDREASVFYALSLLTWADSEHPAGDSEKAMAILNAVFRDMPDHPGVAHYLIHAADSPRLAEMGLEAARRYAQIAPASPHALHMPSHIFARLGLWEEDIRSNLVSLKAARNSSVVHVGAENQLHAMEFLEYAYLQIGEDKKAKEMVASQARIRFDEVDGNLHDFVNRTRANSPALYYLETRNWRAAQALEPDSSAETYNQAIIYWARAVAAGHLRDLQTADDAVAQYNALVEATKQGPRPNRAKYMATQGEEASAWLAFLEGKDQEAIELLRARAERQDAEGKGEIELPAREMLADMLLEMNRPEDALAEFEKSMKVDPNRFNALYGAGRAAERMGQQDKALRYYRQLIRNCGPDAAKRPELARARDSLSESRPVASH
jgi:tetratricopeptide (TPR) repeat protein